TGVQTCALPILALTMLVWVEPVGWRVHQAARRSHGTGPAGAASSGGASIVFRPGTEPAFLYRTPTVRYTFVRTPPDRGAGGRGCSGRPGGPGPRANSGSSGRSGGGGFAPANRK